MGKKKDTKIGHRKKSGPKPKYRPEHHNKLVEKYSEAGLTDAEMAKAFGIARSTFSKWKVDYPEFKAIIAVGKTIADDKVIQSLYRRANGYEHPETKVFCNNGVVTSVDVTKHYPPDTAAAFIWLKNRSGWVDKQELIVEGREVGEKISMEEMEKRMEAKKNAGNGIPTG